MLWHKHTRASYTHIGEHSICKHNGWAKTTELREVRTKATKRNDKVNVHIHIIACTAYTHYSWLLLNLLNFIFVSTFFPNCKHKTKTKQQIFLVESGIFFRWSL